MTFLERIFGVEVMARVREEARQAQARALAQNGARVPATTAPRPLPRTARPQGPVAVTPATAFPAMGVQPREARVEPAIAGSFIDVLPADFPTSILGTAVAAAPPLLGAFASREALLAAIVYAEALAPPIALR